MYSCFTGDFFNDSIPEAELYILSKILHDWDDDKCIQLLAKVYKACKPGRCELLKSRDTLTYQQFKVLMLSLGGRVSVQEFLGLVPCFS